MAVSPAERPLSFDKLRMVSLVEPFAKEGKFLPLPACGREMTQKGMVTGSPLLAKARCEKISPWPKPEGWSDEEVLERHLFKYKQGVATNYHRSAFLPRTLTYTLSAHSKTSET